ncbi:PREDICTED: uncharacterized protein LOC104805815 [Tarenaya hassleriana]|uniref:uncharacterized protein LOC104805815 n=1 Tax=Tarenaya hassleriana TaxID=28532 RepID=UPI00053C6F84|nr:PREDICTED: uncharacterized protein LOC104805815 [Tarenaya hassleriana]
MASATAKPTFSFHRLSQTLSRSSPSPKPPLLLRPAKRELHQLSITFSQHNYRFSPPRSIDVSQEDNPSPPQSSDQPEGGLLPEQEIETPDESSIDSRRLEEKFAVLNTGIYECRSCGYKYDESVGDPSYPIPPGFQFEKLPDDWRCPTCGAAKSFFQSKMVEIAGFAQNQQYGFGGNTLTSGQKAGLIYGTLLLFFMLFLSGYFLQ